MTIDGRSKSDNDTAYTGVDGCKGILNLWQHTATDGAVFLIFNKVRVRDDGNHRVVIVRIAKHTFSSRN